MTLTPRATATLVTVAYLISASCFIIGLKRLSSPRTAVKGNLIGAVGMLLAVLATLVQTGVGSLGLILAGLAIGSVIGALLALKIEMTAMPQMVALLNGFGGAASALVASAELFKILPHGTNASAFVTVPIILGALIGWVTFTGSLIAFAKLQEIMTTAPITYPGQNIFNMILSAVTLVLAVLIVRDPTRVSYFWILSALSAVLGVLAVIPIGGADMPVVIALLNSYSGLAACATGFAINNNALIISGSLVGASGVILTAIMCKAMNRSLANVLFSAFGSAPEEGTAAAAGATGTVKGYDAEDVAIVFDAAQTVIIVPGYGMAVAQAQHAVRELADLLKERGTTVMYAIHPVAGRMPGHMNVLLAEANVPYEELLDLDQVNPHFPEADVALVVGANDITNPAARTEKSSPIYGMPILDVDKARTIVVLKRSMRPGFAGVDNPLYTLPQTMMFFGDAKASLMKLIQELKELGS
ncbi:MAG: NAD(P)(+) transhydrogenase (Re/Si-specific) subunit beta [Candidatus Hydrogenedentota bacterium]|nr:MAG: NAD(P)(+) transhydrogenase (Re/Si-specific) subunit beta [Candidatus Hydrogenedentota bacterium]